jgi:hypothetical protein
MSDLETASSSLKSEHSEIEKHLDALYHQKDQLIKDEEKRAKERLYSAENEE